jgi:acyl-CoA dehydrogenase
VTEPGAGSDVQSIRTTVRKDGDHYIMNGEKMWITNCSVASWDYVLATLDPSKGHKAMCAFAVPAHLPGVTPGKKEVNLGQRCSDTRALVFKDVKIPKKYLLGDEGQGFKIAMRAFDLSRPAVAAGAVGVAQAAFEHATRYALERKAFGKPIAEHQAVAFMLADMAKDIEASRLLTLKAAFELDSGRRSTKFASMAKCMAGDTVVSVTSNAVQVYGGYGYNTEYPVEKLYRDAKIYQIYEGTQQIQRLIISRHVLDEVGRG